MEFESNMHALRTYIFLYTYTPVNALLDLVRDSIMFIGINTMCAEEAKLVVRTLGVSTLFDYCNFILC